MQRRVFNGSLLAAPALMVSGRAFAETWPSRPIRLVVAHPAGSGVDAIARILGEHFSQHLGVPIVIENKPGGQNVIGATNVARSPADGYTIYLATTVALVTNLFMFKDLGYDPRKDFAPIGFVGSTPFVLVVAARSSYTTMKEFVAAAKAAPGKVSIATEGPKTFGGITARFFNSRTGVDTNLVSYGSSGVALQDVIGGHVDAFFIDMAAAAPLTRQGQLKMLAVTSSSRVPGWDVPTLAETAPGFDMIGWFALVAPTGTPPEIVSRLNAELNAAIADKTVADKIHDLGPQTPGVGTPLTLQAFLTQEIGKWASISRDVGLLPE